jgi:hypothetical protein
MRKILAALLLLLGSIGAAHAQQSKAALDTEIDTNWPNNTSGAITPALLRSTVKDIVASYVDWLTCTAQGSTLYWNSTGTPSCLAPGTSGQFLKTNGAGADPAWATFSLTASQLTMENNFRFIGNNAAANSAAQELTANTLFDWIGSTRGSLFYRGVAAWSLLTPGTDGFVLTTKGVGADPIWTSPSSGGTVTTITCNDGMECSTNPITVTGTLTPARATQAQIWSGTRNKFIDGDGLANGGAFGMLTPASPTVSVNFSSAVNFSLALTGSTQLGSPSNALPGRTGCIFITKDLTSRTLSYGPNWKFAGGTAPTLSTTTTTVPDVLCYLAHTSSFIWATMTKAVQ